MKIAIATGTRADWGLLQPVASSLRNAGVETLVIALHQHLLPEMGNTVEEIINDGFLPVARIPASGSPGRIMTQAAAGITDTLPGINPDALLILGDRCEMLGVASAALLSGVPIIHIAGGTISEGAFDDSVRHAISKMATLHFPETDKSADRLIQMGENPDSVVVAGAIGVQNSLNLPKWSRQQLSDSLGWDPGTDFLVVTLHAATLESYSPLEVQQNMLQALGELPPHIRLLITYPNSDVEPAPLIADLQKFAESQGDRVKLIPSLGRIRYLSAVALSRGVVGNSSSGLVEVPSLGVPTLDIGIRQQGRECGSTVVHCGTSVSEIAAGLERILSDEMRQSVKQAENPYYQPDTVKIITDRILSTDFHPYPIKKFHSS